MNILRRMLAAALVPSFNSDQAELKRLRGTTPMRRGWFRLVASGNTTGFAHVCECAQEIKIVHPLDMFKSYRCQCGETFALLEPRRRTPAEIENYLTRLPARQSAAPAQQRPAPQVGTWNLDGDDTEYTGTADLRTQV
jgi:hypothetical protein